MVNYLSNIYRNFVPIILVMEKSREEVVISTSFP